MSKVGNLKMKARFKYKNDTENDKQILLKNLSLCHLHCGTQK